MKIHEYQAKELMAKYGIPVPRGSMAASPEEARKVAEELGGRVVVKAQVHAGGRGKAGGVRVVDSPEAAAEFAASILGTQLVTFQTGPEGVPVNSVLVEETMDITQELYTAIVLDPSERRPVVIASAAGGMEIEEVAAETPGEDPSRCRRPHRRAAAMAGTAARLRHGCASRTRPANGGPHCEALQAHE